MVGPLVSPGLSSIKEVPILISAAGNDENCTAKIAQKFSKEIGDAVKSFRVLDGVGHEYFWDATRTDDLLEEIRLQLELDVNAQHGKSLLVFEAITELFNEIFESAVFSHDNAVSRHISTASAIAIASFATIF